MSDEEQAQDERLPGETDDEYCARLGVPKIGGGTMIAGQNLNPHIPILRTAGQTNGHELHMRAF